MDNIYDILTICNPDSEPFDVIYDNKIYNTIQPGQSVSMARFLAEHGMKHLIDKILNKLNIPLNKHEERMKWADKILINQQSFTPVNVKSERDFALEQINQQVKGSDLEALLAKRNKPDVAIPPVPVTNVVPQNTPTVPVNPPPGNNPEIVKEEGMLPELVIPETDVVPQTPTPTVVPQGVDPALVPQNTVQTTEAPTRPQLYDYARNTLKMDLEDKKTMLALDAMSVPELVKELQFEQ